MLKSEVSPYEHVFHLPQFVKTARTIKKVHKNPPHTSVFSKMKINLWFYVKTCGSARITIHSPSYTLSRGHLTPKRKQKRAASVYVKQGESRNNAGMPVPLVQHRVLRWWKCVMIMYRCTSCVFTICLWKILSIDFPTRV